MGTNIKLLLLVTMSIMTVACSSRPLDGSSTSASEDPAVTPTPTPNPSTSLVASCNQFSGSAGTVGRVQAYFDQFGNINTNLLRLRFTGVPTNFGSIDTLFIEFHRAKVTSAGVFEEDLVPLSFRLETKDTLAPASQWFNISPSNVGFNRQALFTASSSQNINKLLDYNFLIQGVDALLGYQVLRVIIKSTAGGSVTIAGYADLLIPQFYSNPNVYDDTHPLMLNQMHPNWSIRGDANITEAGFLAYTKQYCLYQ